MSETFESADSTWTKAKCGLLLSLMKERFEVKVYDMLEKESFSSMEELDLFLDEELRKYYAERIAVKNYYDQKLSQMQGD